MGEIFEVGIVLLRSFVIQVDFLRETEIKLAWNVVTILIEIEELLAETSHGLLGHLDNFVIDIARTVIKVSGILDHPERCGWWVDVRYACRRIRACRR
jgi:hypothetical protein